ncbi:MAG: hypothetical protein ACM3N5_00470 [Candidatus Eiseniibacteriota bacterium]
MNALIASHPKTDSDRHAAERGFAVEPARAGTGNDIMMTCVSRAEIARLALDL